MIIANTPQYQLSVSKPKNRAYLRIVGFWRNPEQVGNYLDDWSKAISQLSPGFTLVTDAREMKIHPVAVRKLHEEAQAMVLKAGVKSVAEIQLGKITEMQLDGLSNDTTMPKRNFVDPEAAERWLDSLS